MEKTTVSQVGIKFGAILSIALIVFSLITSIADIAFVKGVNYINWLIFGAIIFLALKAFKEANEFMSFKEGLSIGMITSTIGGVVSSVFFLIYITFIDNSFVKKALDFTRAEMEKDPKLAESPESMEMAMAWTEKMFSPGMLLAFGIIGSLFTGLILSLIISAIMKKQQPNEFA